MKKIHTFKNPLIKGITSIEIFISAEVFISFQSEYFTAQHH